MKCLGNFLPSLIFCCATTVYAENWPSWRGPERDGISKEIGLPVTWSATQNVAWKLPLPGKGGSTPVVWGERIFLTSAEGKELVLLCVHTSGKPLWKGKLGPVQRLNVRYDEGNDASPSPSTDGKHVWAYAGSGQFTCFDVDGKELWKFNVQERYGRFRIQHGMHTTPLLYQDRLYLTLLHAGGHYLIALDKASGKEVWKVERKSDARGESREAYTTPCLWQNGQGTCIAILGCDYATGHRLSDGAEIWRLNELNPKARYSTAHRIIASPVAVPELLVVPTARGKIVVGVKPGAKGLITPGSEFEQWRTATGSPDVPSPLVHGGLVYLCRENGVLICLDAKTGKTLYQRPLERDRYRASPVYADGKIYCTARNGTFSVVKAGPKFELLAANVLPDEFTASPAISEGRMYLRGFRALYAIQEQGRK